MREMQSSFMHLKRAKCAFAHKTRKHFTMGEKSGWSGCEDVSLMSGKIYMNVLWDAFRVYGMLQYLYRVDGLGSETFFYILMLTKV